MGLELLIKKGRSLGSWRALRCIKMFDTDKDADRLEINTGDGPISYFCLNCQKPMG